MADPGPAFASVIRSVRQWLESVVVDLDLCPFVKRELWQNRVRFVVSAATNEEQLLIALGEELALLNADLSFETTLLIHPHVLERFFDYNQFLSYADGLLTQTKLEGVYQIASFHPHYQFDGTDPDDAENYTNRSPYPMLHIIREQSLEGLIAGYPDVELIPARNIARMNNLGKTKLQALLQACFNAGE